MMTYSTYKAKSVKHKELSDLVQLNDHGRKIVNYSAKSHIPIHTNNFWLVITGVVKLIAKSPNGGDIVVGIVGKNQTIGAQQINQATTSTVAMTDTELLYVSMAEIENCRALALVIIESLSTNCRQSQELAYLLGLHRVKERVQAFLQFLANECGELCSDGQKINIKITHQEIANTLSTTRVTISNTISILKDEGWLLVNPKRLFIISSTKESDVLRLEFDDKYRGGLQSLKTF